MTPEGKARVSLNRVHHGLYCRGGYALNRYLVALRRYLLHHTPPLPPEMKSHRIGRDF